MRGLLLALLIGNIVYFVWQLAAYRHQQAVLFHTDDSSQLLDGERLILVAEREASAQKPIEPVVMAVPVAQAPVQLAPQAEVVELGAGVESVSGVEPSAAVAVEAIDSVAAENVSEPQTNAAAAVEPPAPVAQLAAGQCLYLGSFAKPEQQQAYQQRVNAVGIKAQALELEVQAAVDYWVHIKPFANRQQALVKLRELQSKQIDSFIIPQGPFQNGISLGVFDRRENAEKRQQEIVAKGYSAEIGKNQKMLKEQWLMLDHENSTKFSQTLFAALKKDFSFVEIKKDACKGVAR